jgi:nucleotide-binding universal stress UspA family protein
MKTIIAATDFSPNAMHATRYAAALASATGARLILFHHFSYPIPAAGMPYIDPMDMEELATDLEKRLKKVKAGLLKDFPDLFIKIMVRSWIMVRDLEEAFRDEKASLVVMGMHGESPVLNTLLGSKTARVIRSGRMPAIVVPAKASFQAPKKILFAFDFESQTNMETIVPLRDLALTFDAYVKVLTFFDDDETSYPVALKEERVVKNKLDHLFSSVRHTYSLEEESVLIDGILDHSTSYGADLVAMIPRHHSYLSNLLNGSVTQEIATRIRVPLLVLPDKVQVEGAGHPEKA